MPKRKETPGDMYLRKLYEWHPDEVLLGRMREMAPGYMLRLESEEPHAAHSN